MAGRGFVAPMKSPKRRRTARKVVQQIGRFTSAGEPKSKRKHARPPKAVGNREAAGAGRTTAVMASGVGIGNWEGLRHEMVGKPQPARRMPYWR